ncbi:33 kDa ribonucleoprotein, chloroplastic-like [Salvia divinorum]|uniref:33 kDa ribonucleoprotein, chloroplastic-like n=1 Tax=Salvia divinorum TaxID=28513 RepID=A0ABD1GNY1_SALDI
MGGSSLSLAVAALPTSSHSLSSTPLDHFSLNCLPCKLSSIRTSSKLKPLSKNYNLSSSSSIHCASTAFNQDEEEPSNGALGSVSEVGALQIADAGRLYAGNLPFSMTSAQLTEIFAEAGRVVSAEIVYDRVTDRSRGFAFVTMGSIEEAKEAIRLFDGAQIGGRTSKVNFPEVPRGGEREVMSPKIRSSYQGYVDSPFKIYAGNLSWSLTSQALRDAFSHQPGYLSAKIIYDRDSGRSRGFGFITFSSAEEVESALSAMDGVELEGRPLRLNLAEQRAAATASPPEVENNSELVSSGSASQHDS